MLLRITYRERLASYLTKMLQHIRNVLQVTWRSVLKSIRNIWQATWNKMWQGSRIVLHILACYLKKLFQRITYQERLASYLKKRLQRIRNIWQATCNKMWQGSRIVLHVAWRSCSNVSRIRNALHVTCRRCYNVSRLKNVLQVTWRRCYNVAGTSFKLLDENVTTYQEPLAN